MISTITTELLRRAHQAQDRATYLAIALPAVSATVSSQYSVLVEARAGRWVTQAEAGTPRPLPFDLLSEVSDRDAPISRDGWIAVPVKSRPAVAEAMLLRPAIAAEASQIMTTLAPRLVISSAI